MIYGRGFLTDKNFKFKLVGVSLYIKKRKPQSVSPPIGIKLMLIVLERIMKIIFSIRLGKAVLTVSYSRKSKKITLSFRT